MSKSKGINHTLRIDDSDIDPDHTYFDYISQNKTKGRQEIASNQTFNKPWIEKYRPETVDDLVMDDATLKKIRKIIDDGVMPNIIITGSPGIGKTTTILCLAKEILKEHYKDGVLELNASDDRGVKNVQETMEYFCKKKFTNEDSKHKIILLDEADNMTKKAQQLVNTLMQEYNGTRFAFTCNNSGQIIEAIQSRCVIFRYSRLTIKQMKSRLEHICKLENIKYSDEGLNTIITTSQGDLRQAINNLQLTFNGYSEIIPDNVYKLCDRPHPLVIQNIFEACKNKDFKTALEFLRSLTEKGYSSSDIVFAMMYTLKNISNTVIDERTKIMYLEEIGKTSLTVSQGMNTPLQLTGSIARLCKD